MSLEPVPCPRCQKKPTFEPFHDQGKIIFYVALCDCNDNDDGSNYFNNILMHVGASLVRVAVTSNKKLKNYSKRLAICRWNHLRTNSKLKHVTCHICGNDKLFWAKAASSKKFLLHEHVTEFKSGTAISKYRPPRVHKCRQANVVKVEYFDSQGNPV